MKQTMIEIKGATMDFRRERGGGRSLKEFIVNLLKGKLRYDRFRAVDGVTAEIKKGEVVGIIGRNGAGKSTLLKMIAGVLTPTDGSIRLHGNIAPMLELGAGFDHDLTARENIYLNGAILGTFSSGMLMRLAFAIATQGDPEILIVDEILAVGDSHFRQKSEGRMREMMGGGTTVLMVSHVLGQIRSLCDRVIWLDHGHVVMDGDTKTVCDAYEGLIDFDNAPTFEIGCHMDDIARVTMYPDNWLPPDGSYKIKTGKMGLVSGNLRCPFGDLTGEETITVSLDEGAPTVIRVTEEYMSFEVKGAPDTVVTVHIRSNFYRKPEKDSRNLSVVLEDTDGN